MTDKLKDGMMTRQYTTTRPENSVGARVRQWRRHNFGDLGPLRDVAQLSSAVGELASAIGKDEDGTPEMSRVKIDEAVGDILLAALAVADRYAVDVVAAAEERLQRLEALAYDLPSEDLPLRVWYNGAVWIMATCWYDLGQVLTDAGHIAHPLDDSTGALNRFQRVADMQPVRFAYSQDDPPLWAPEASCQSDGICVATAHRFSKSWTAAAIAGEGCALPRFVNRRLCEFHTPGDI